MSVATRRLLLALTLFLTLLPVTAGRPGLPPTLKADEPAYYLMALSLVEDGDLICAREDYERLVAKFPYTPTQNLILMSGDAWRTAYFGKPWIYPLLAVPLVALIGYNGLLAFNLLLVAAMIWMGTIYLSRFNSEPMALLFSAAFFLIGPAVPYAFWIHPEVFNMAAAAACLYFAFHQPDTEAATGLRRLLARPTVRAGVSALALGLGAYNKPVLAALGLPALFLYARRREWKSLGVWALAGLLTAGALSGASWWATGTPSAYLGVSRTAVQVDGPDDMDAQLAQAELMTAHRRQANSWHWVVQRPDFDWQELVQNCRYFLVGRHTGLVPYMPLAVLALGLFLLHGRRSGARWLLLASLAAIALFFLIVIPINWHGGGGFVGNRYYVMVYPAFLFLVTAVRPSAAVFAGIAAGTLLLGPVLASPYGAPVPHPTLQAHVRSPVFRWFPLELTIRDRIPGYVYAGYGRLLFIGRRDVVSVQDGTIRLQGATPVELWLLSDRELDSLLFEVRSPAMDNSITLDAGDREVTVEFGKARREERRRKTVELPLGDPGFHWEKRVRWKPGARAYVYKLRLESSTGLVPRGPRRDAAHPFPGAELVYLGTREQVARVEHYQVEWLGADLPETLVAGRRIEITVRAVNRGASAWRSDDPLPVLLGYHWQNAQGRTVEFEGERSSLPGEVAPGETVEATIGVSLPAEPGRYRLVLDVIREPIAWFSARGGATLDLPIDVVGATDLPDPIP